MLLFHGTDVTIDALAGPICLTGDHEIAATYAAHAVAYTTAAALVYAIDLTDDAQIAAEADLVDTAIGIGLGVSVDQGGSEWHSVYELADRDEIQAALTARGFIGARYGDTTADGVTHDTVQIWAPAGCAALVSVETVGLGSV